eukprot:TRINITY_DN4864_c0_g2_i3.p1 TRINITY_DN4864_c0_g2~~TRINITY_DN4864_c0_g2_i3.p1  ORF type:complete len:956 (+),score=196.47 TRINITY_DN4864_c0_g2_i3:66-2933(+)
MSVKKEVKIEPGIGSKREAEPSKEEGERKKVRFGGEPAAAEVKDEKKDVKTEIKIEKMLADGLQDVEAAKWGPGRGEGLYEKAPDVEACFKRVGNCEWDSEAWDLILRDLRRYKLEDTEDVYKRILSIFPACATAIVGYVASIQEDYRFSMEDNRTKIDQIFREKLREYQHVTVWKAYTDYVSKYQEFTETRKAYSYCLDRVGNDFESDLLWNDYIKFLSKRGSEFSVQQEIRKAYNDRLKIPMKNLPETWKAYQAWEKSVGTMKITEALRTAHERALYHYNETLAPLVLQLDTQYCARPLEVDYPADIKIPVSTTLGSSVTKDHEQAALWYRLVNHEMSNPMSVEPSILKHRIVTMCKKALICMSKIPLFWYVQSRFLFEKDLYDEANKVFSDSLKACPTSLLLRFAYTDMLSHLQPSKLLETPMRRPTQEDIDNKIVKTVWQHPGQGMVCGEGVEAKRLMRFTPYVLGTAVFEDTLSRVPHGELRTLTWVHFMRFLKSASRMEAQQDAYQSKHLQRAHKDDSTLSGPFYSAIARLEKVTPPQIAEGSLDPRSILERGYMRQKEEKQVNPLFLLNYIQALWGTGDENTLRNLFSQLFDGSGDWQDNTDANAALLVHNKRVEFELWKGGVRGVHVAEKMREDKFGKMKIGTYARQLVHRYSFEGLVPASPREMKAIDQLEHAFFRLATIGLNGENPDDVIARSMKLRGESPLTENLAQHGNPLRSRRTVGEPEIRTKWVHYPTTSSRWSVIDPETLSRVVTPFGTWDPKHAPRPEKDHHMIGKNFVAGTGATRLTEDDVAPRDDYSSMPSTIAHLVKKLPHRDTFQGSKPKVQYIVDCFKKAVIPKLVEGRVPEESFAEARKYLADTLGIETTDISVLQAKTREKIEELRNKMETPEDRKKVDKCTLSLAQVLTHARARREILRNQQQHQHQHQHHAPGGHRAAYPSAVPPPFMK